MPGNLIIFDLDGTLFKTETVTLTAVKKTMLKNGISVLEDNKMKGFIGKTMVEFCDHILIDISNEDRLKLASQIRKYERELISSHGELYPGIKEILNEIISLGYELAICSNGSIEYIELVLKTFNIENLFTYIKGSKKDKSKSDRIREILRDVKPSQAFVVGDTIDDISAAEKNKLPVIGVSYGYGQELSTEFIAEDPEDILNYIHMFRIFGEIENKFIKSQVNKKNIIGVNGVDTSGKTRFSSNMSKFLKEKGYKIEVIHLDDFHNKSNIRKQGKNEIEAYIDNAFNLRLLENELLLPIKKNRKIDKKIRLLNLETDTFTNEKYFYIDEETIVILEGVLLYRDNIDKYFDYRIYLDISFSEVINRAKIRDVPLYGEEFLERYKVKYIPIQKRYISKNKPKCKSDMIIDNNNYNRPKFIVK